jgi:hypothetical protein
MKKSRLGAIRPISATLRPPPLPLGSSLVAEPFYAALGFAALEPLMIEMGAGVAFRSIRMSCLIAE